MNFNSINPFVPQIPTSVQISSTQNRPPLSVKSTSSPQPRTGDRQTTSEGNRPGKINAITYKQVPQATTLTNQCIASLTDKKGFRDFNTHADALKATDGWKDRMAAQVSRMSVPDQQKLALKLASMSLYDLVDHDREVVGHLLHCLSKSNDLDVPTKNNLNHKVAELKTLIINIEEKEPHFKYLGGGAVNKVYRVTAHIDENGEQTTAGNGAKNVGVFKPDPSELDPITLARESTWGTPKGAGIKPGDEAHMSARSVASYKLDKALYGNDPIGVKTEYIILNGKRGILMDMAPGGSPEPPKLTKRQITIAELQSNGVLKLLDENGLINSRGKFDDGWVQILERTMGASDIHLESGKIIGTFPEFHLNRDSEWIVKEGTYHHKLAMESIDEFGGYENLTPKDKNLISEELEVKDFRVENGRLIVIIPETPINLENPVTAEGLHKLQVFDWISGQVDRHPENYYIDPKTGKVLAIDNDCAFGVYAVPKGVDVRSQDRLGGIVPNMGSLMLRMPTVVTESVKNDIMNLFNDPEKVKATLDPDISGEEIAATIKRLAMLAQHVNSNKCKIVANAEDLYSPENLLLQDSNNSLYLRERDRYRSKTWNDLRKNEEKI